MPIIELKDVQSSQIHSIGHDPETNVLAIRFYRGYGRDQRPGALYHYQNVPEADYIALRDAESIGRHFGQQIKPFPDKYPFTRIDEDAATFEIDGARYTLDEALQANAEDSDVCAWLRSAAVGDRYDGTAVRVS